MMVEVDGRQMENEVSLVEGLGLLHLMWWHSADLHFLLYRERVTRNLEPVLKGNHLVSAMHAVPTALSKDP